MDISVVIPWQDRGDEARRVCAEWVIDYFTAMGIGEIALGTYPVDDAPLNRSRLRNEGAKAATGDVLLFCDADCIVTKDAALTACVLAADGAGAVLPFDRWPTYLTVAQDAAIRQRGADPWLFAGEQPSYYRDGFIPYEWSVGPSYAITKKAFQGLGGLDEEYYGWGEEEKDFLVRSRFLLGELRTVPGNTLHLNYYGVDGRPPQTASCTPGTVEYDMFRRNQARFHAMLQHHLAQRR